MPVLITQEMRQWLELLLEQRINHSNPTNSYVFPSSAPDSHIWDQMTFGSTEEFCGARELELLRSNRLIKHIASIAQVLNLSLGHVWVGDHFIRGFWLLRCCSKSTPDSHIWDQMTFGSTEEFCGARELELLRSNRLRKHIASIAQVLNLSLGHVWVGDHFIRGFWLLRCCSKSTRHAYSNLWFS